MTIKFFRELFILYVYKGIGILQLSRSLNLQMHEQYSLVIHSYYFWNNVQMYIRFTAIAILMNK